MGEAETIAAEKRGYAKGYAAGRRYADREISRALLDFRREQFRQQAFLAALPACVAAQGWARDKAPINSLEDRTKLAVDFANIALKHFWFSGERFDGDRP